MYGQKTVHLRVRDDLPRVIATYPVTISEKPANSNYPKGNTEYKWETMHMKDLKDIKQAVVS